MRRYWRHTGGHCISEMTADPVRMGDGASGIHKNVNDKGDNHECIP